ncbi:MAG: hypothetical protein KDA92_26665 [Planctomycetales bacterium]|nr:hypothetical protein [Planctomycetales bacterium]
MKWLIGFVASALLLVCGNAVAQEPAADMAPQSVPYVTRVIVDGEGYRCYRLDATVELQYLYIDTASRRVTFWGARVLDLGPASPLPSIGVEVGDVITRLDRIPVATRAFRRRNQVGNWVWQLPEMDRHYSLTHVRFIKAGTSAVLEEVVDLGPLGGPLTPPVPPAVPAGQPGLAP